MRYLAGQVPEQAEACPGTDAEIAVFDSTGPVEADVGEAKKRKERLADGSALCIFCGGQRVATTEEHCPPRALFREKKWPEGYVFPACEECNGGTSDDDLMVAFLAQLSEAGNAHKKTAGLMYQVKRQFPGFIEGMFQRSTAEARRLGRKVRLRPGPGETYRELPVVKLPEEAHKSVSVLARKLTKAIYFKQTQSIFPTDGGIMFQWFTNAQKMEHGRIVLLDAVAHFAAMSAPKRRNGKDLTDQFDYKYSVDKSGELHLLQVLFGDVFGFVTIFSQIPGRLEAMEDGIKKKHPRLGSPFRFLSTNSVSTAKTGVEPTTAGTTYRHPQKQSPRKS